MNVDTAELARPRLFAMNLEAKLPKYPNTETCLYRATG